MDEKICGEINSTTVQIQIQDPLCSKELKNWIYGGSSIFNIESLFQLQLTLSEHSLWTAHAEQMGFSG